MIKCQCGRPDCQIEIRYEDGNIWLVGKNGEESLLYMDANAWITMIHMASEALKELQRVAIERKV